MSYWEIQKALIHWQLDHWYITAIFFAILGLIYYLLFRDER